MNNPATIWFMLVAYIIGATPWGYWVGKLKGVDIRDHGSGNIGTTNVFRVLGKTWGIIVFILDVLKGLIPVILVKKYLPILEETIPPETWKILLVAVAAILGHNFTFWLKFKGGKGIATSTGALVAIVPIPILVATIVWVALFFLTKYVAIASIGAALAVPIVVIIECLIRGEWDYWLVVFSTLLMILAVWKHKTNIGRLRSGTENRFGKKAKN